MTLPSAFLILWVFSSVLPSASSLAFLPTNPTDCVTQAARSVSRAFNEGGHNRQVLRLPLSEAIYKDKEEGFVADRAIGWQGGPEETYRYLSPIVESLLRKIRLEDALGDGGLSVKVSEQILLDFDGSALQTSEHPAGALFDVQALLQPNADSYYLKTMRTIEEQFSNTPGKPRRLFLVVNPAWRDASSFGLFESGKARSVLDKYETTYACDQFVVRGLKVILLKCWPDDWDVFVEDESDVTMPARLVGSFEARPTYDEIDARVVEHLTNIRA